nr:hypothetical protein [Tanacetum cinerariifolium]
MDLVLGLTWDRMGYVGNKMHKAFPLLVIEFPLAEEVPTASEESSHCQKKRDDTAKRIALLKDPIILVSSSGIRAMDQQNPTLAKIPILDTGKFKQWQFRIQQYLQHEHYALWEVIEFRDSYEVPTSAATTEIACDGTGKKSGRTVIVTTEDMQKRKNDVKARTTLLLSLPDEHQLQFSKYKTAQELWAAILKTFGGNEATKKTKKNLLKQQYGNFKMEGSETLEQTFNRLQVIIGQLQGNEDVNTASVSTASTNVPTASANIGVASISQDTACAYIASQSSGFQIKFEDINQIDEDDMEEMDIKQNMDLLSMRADRFWKKTGKKISIQRSDVAGFDKSKSYMANDEENHALVVNEEALTEFALMANTSAESKELETLKKEKEGLDGKLAGFLTASKDLDNLIESQRSNKNKDGLGYSVVPPPAQIYSSPKKDLSWTCLLEFADDTVTDYSRPSPTIESTSGDDQNRNPSVFETEASPSTITPKPFIKFVKPNDSLSKAKTNKVETSKKPPIKKRVKKGTSRSQDNTHKRNFHRVNRKFSSGSRNFPTVNRKFPTANRKFPTGSTKFSIDDMGKKGKAGSSQNNNDNKGYWDSGCSRHMTSNISYLSDYEPFDKGYGSSQNNNDDKGYWDSGCSRHMTSNISYLSDYEPFDKGYVCFGQGGCKIIGKGTIKTGQNFKLSDDDNVLLKTLRQHNMYSIDLNNIITHKDLTCLVAKASADEWKFEVKGDEGYFLGYSMSSKAFRVFNKRTRKVEENLHVEFLENKAIEKGTKDAARQEVKNDVSSLRYIALPNWVHDALLESSLSKPQDDCSTDVPESSGNFNPTTTSINPPADQLETLTVESPIPTVSSPFPTACFTDSPEPSGDARLISKRVANQVETPSLDNILTLANRFEDILGVTTNSDESNGVEADVSKMETTITASPTPTLRIHKDHPKSQIISAVDTLIQTRNKSKEVGEQSFIATIHQKTNPALL